DALTLGGTTPAPIGAVTYDGPAHDHITLGGGTGSGLTRISNVADGTSLNDAVNLGQLQDAVDAAEVHYFSIRPINGTSNENNNKATGDDALAIGQANLA